MKVLTYLSATEVDPARIAGATAVVIDVIRATTTIVEALANGAKAIYPTLSTEEALRLANSLGRENSILCGERKGLKVEGFDLGNSPREFARTRVEGRSLVMSTTNGTRAFLAAAGADRVIAGAFVNLDAVVDSASRAEEVALVCSGKEGRFCLDDALCAGAIVRSLQARAEGTELNDGSRAVARLAEGLEPSADALAGMDAGRALVEVGLEDDLALCADTNRHAIVPEMHDRMIRL